MPDGTNQQAPDEIGVTTLGDLLLGAARRWPEREFIVLPDARFTYSDMAERVIRRARGLMALGTRPGDHVGIFLPTCIEFTEALFAIALAGAVPVLINARYRGAELRYLIENSDSVAVLTTGRVADGVNLLERLNEEIGDAGSTQDPPQLDVPGLPMLRRIITMTGDAPGALGSDALDRLAEQVPVEAVHERRSRVRVRDTGLILYTSGTTSNPKGCLLSHEAIVRNGQELGRRYDMTGEDRFWSPLAMYHIGAIMPITAVLAVGGTYLTTPYFDAGRALRMLEDEKVTINYVCFWTMLADLMNHPDFATTDLSATRLMNSNLALQPEALQEQLARAMPHAVQVSTYGLTEAAGTVSTNGGNDSYKARTTRLGSPLRGVGVRIVDAEDRDAPAGEHGEIIVNGYGIIDGYYKGAEKTEAALRGGWLHTGDIGSLDEAGDVMFHGRVKDMLKVGGENVAALEVEAFIGDHPAVKLCQVVGCPDSRLVEVPAAFVELKPDATANEDDIIAFCRNRIASFKVPRHVRFVTEWPMGASKIQKFKLRDGLIAELGIEDTTRIT